MQVVNGMAPDRQPVKELLKIIPTRLLRFVLRVAQLQRGRYVILYNVGEDDISWTIAPIQHVER